MPAVEVASRATNVTSLIVSAPSPTSPGQPPHVNDQFCSAPVSEKSVPQDTGVQVPSSSQLTRVVSCFSVVRAPPTRESNNQGATRWWTHTGPPQELGTHILPDCALSSLAPWQREPKIGGSMGSAALIMITHGFTIPLAPLINFPKATFRASWGLSLTSATYGGKTANPVRLPTTRHRPLS